MDRGCPNIANTLIFLFHLHARAATERNIAYMRPKVLHESGVASSAVAILQRRGSGSKDYSARENGEGGDLLPKLQRRGSKDTVRERTTRAETAAEAPE